MSADNPSQETLITQLGHLLQSLEASGRSVLLRQDEDLLQSIVDAAAQIFGAAAASIALVDESQSQLVFRVAYGAGKQNLVGLSIPVDHGLAGYVVMTGQPMAVSDVQHDARFNASFASSTGYLPHSILATPLLAGDRVIGVMEVLDKLNAPSFGMQDMDLLALFAHQAAIAIHQSQQYDRLGSALVGGLRRLAREGETPALAQAFDALDLEGPDASLLEIADEFNAISQLGSAEQRACYEILSAFGRYARSRNALY